MNLKKCLLADSDTLSAMGTTIETEHGPLTHIDNDGSVLAVCHRDWVYWERKPKISSGAVAKCPQLDDRLGLHAVLNVLPKRLRKMGSKVRFDILITDSEEIGQSTAQYFQPEDFGVESDRYNWLFQFDRAGSDAVMYDYHTKANVNRLEDVGYKVGHGSFTDICYLEQLGVAGWNLGTGYHRQHTKDCYADLGELSNSVGKFAKFIDRHAGERIEHVETAKGQAGSTDPWGYNYCENEAISTIYCDVREISFPICAACNHEVVYSDYQCPNCGSDLCYG
jgi:hypothetical protein